MSSVVRWATAGCVGAVALAIVLVAVQPTTAAQRATQRSLDRTGVRVVQAAPSSGRAFEDPGSALRLAAAALVFGVAAGVALGAATRRVGHLPVVALVGFGISVAVLAIAGRWTWRDVGAQVAFWAVAAGWLAWSGRPAARAVSGAARPRP